MKRYLILLMAVMLVTAIGASAESDPGITGDWVAIAQYTAPMIVDMQSAGIALELAVAPDGTARIRTGYMGQWIDARDCTWTPADGGWLLNRDGEELRMIPDGGDLLLMIDEVNGFRLAREPRTIVPSGEPETPETMEPLVGRWRVTGVLAGGYFGIPREEGMGLTWLTVMPDACAILTELSGETDVYALSLSDGVCGGTNGALFISLGLLPDGSLKAALRDGEGTAQAEFWCERED